MSIDATLWAWKQNIRPVQKLLLLSLADRADERNVCWPSLERLKLDTGLDKRTIRQALAELVESGLISRSHDDGRGYTYTLLGVSMREDVYGTGDKNATGDKDDTGIKNATGSVDCSLQASDVAFPAIPPTGCKNVTGIKSATGDKNDTGIKNAPRISHKDKKKEENNIYTPNIAEKLDPARARAVQGNFFEKNSANLSDEPGMEFQELRQFYDEHCRAEAPLTGFIEYRQLRASRRWPGLSRICGAIDEHSRADPANWKIFCPGLTRFLREHWWEKKPSRASSVARKMEFDGAEADASVRRVFEQRKKAREAANGAKS